MKRHCFNNNCIVFKDIVTVTVTAMMIIIAAATAAQAATRQTVATSPFMKYEERQRNREVAAASAVIKHLKEFPPDLQVVSNAIRESDSNCSTLSRSDSEPSQTECIIPDPQLSENCCGGDTPDRSCCGCLPGVTYKCNGGKYCCGTVPGGFCCTYGCLRNFDWEGDRCACSRSAGEIPCGRSRCCHSWQECINEECYNECESNEFRCNSASKHCCAFGTTCCGSNDCCDTSDGLVCGKNGYCVQDNVFSCDDCGAGTTCCGGVTCCSSDYTCEGSVCKKKSVFSCDDCSAAGMTCCGGATCCTSSQTCLGTTCIYNGPGPGPGPGPVAPSSFGDDDDNMMVWVYITVPVGVIVIITLLVVAIAVSRQTSKQAAAAQHDITGVQLATIPHRVTTN
jgi:hypothetical protein